MSRVITSLLRLKDGCLDVLSARFARWTKPFRTSLPLATLTDLVLFVEILFRIRPITFRSISLFKMENGQTPTHIFSHCP